MTAVTGAGRPSTRKSAGANRAGGGFGFAPGRELPPISAGSEAVSDDQHPGPVLRFTALDGLRGLAVPFVLAFALRGDIAALNAPVAVQYLVDGGYVLIPLFFVLAGFLLGRPLTAILAAATPSSESEAGPKSGAESQSGPELGSRPGSGSRPGPGARTTHLGARLARRIAPLHILAWTITFGWLVTGTSPGTIWEWLSSALLLNGIVGPQASGYPVSWSVSVGLGALIVLLAVALVLASRTPRPRAAPKGLVRPGALPSRSSRPGHLVTGIAVTAVLLGAGALLLTGPDAIGTVGVAAMGQALLGLGAGLLSFRVLEGGTGTLKAPLPGTAPAFRPTSGPGSTLALAALLFCVYRSDLMFTLHLLPVFPIAAALVYLLAVPRTFGRSTVNRLLDTAALQWLGARALALYLLHGPVQLTVERIGELSGLDRESTPAAYGIPIAVVLGSLLAADLGHRLLEHRFAPPPPAPVAVSPYRVPRVRPERLGIVDPEAIPRELRLLPLPRKSTPAAAAPIGKGVAAVVGTGTPTPIDPAPTAASTQPIELPVGRATRNPLPGKLIRSSIERAIETPTAKTSTTPVETAATKVARKPVRKAAAKTAAKPIAKSVELPADKPTTKAVELPAAKPIAKSVELPADKPTRKPAARKPSSKPADTSIDLDRPTPATASDAQVLDADDLTLDADVQP